MLHTDLKEKIYRPQDTVIKLRKLIRGFPDDVKIVVCEAMPAECIFRIPLQIEPMRRCQNGFMQIIYLCIYNVGDG